ncbi:uncharacterized protein BYT42DRAFT_614947 [Radiomyces spectabilis]|uniref:uncharacterized protein n=1 Tax=Radiomyces spectabilis TaxID=64574 RepID=UPI002220AFCB|nr:uncharacterized protein BYT42DRAFT_614947 [Radiomyces spectabilis]KAI8376168.1 hypothetical protein BYT42DRAFT_614947 [Radiomyces spectabilis]
MFCGHAFVKTHNSSHFCSVVDQLLTSQADGLQYTAAYYVHDIVVMLEHVDEEALQLQQHDAADVLNEARHERRSDPFTWALGPIYAGRGSSRHFLLTMAIDKEIAAVAEDDAALVEDPPAIIDHRTRDALLDHFEDPHMRSIPLCETTCTHDDDPCNYYVVGISCRYDKIRRTDRGKFMEQEPVPPLPRNAIPDKSKPVTVCHQHYQLFLEFYNVAPAIQKFATVTLQGQLYRCKEAKSNRGLVNAVEVYGRKKMVDIHREPFGSLKNTSMRASLPPSRSIPGHLANDAHKRRWRKVGDRNAVHEYTGDIFLPSRPEMPAFTWREIGGLKLGKLDSQASRIYVDQECPSPASVVLCFVHTLGRPAGPVPHTFVLIRWFAAHPTQTRPYLRAGLKFGTTHPFFA